MISGHMDEVGFMVTKIDKHGFISFTPVGGLNQVMLSQKVTITTDSGKKKLEVSSVLNRHMS